MRAARRCWPPIWSRTRCCRRSGQGRCGPTTSTSGTGSRSTRRRLLAQADRRGHARRPRMDVYLQHHPDAEDPGRGARRPPLRRLPRLRADRPDGREATGAWLASIARYARDLPQVRRHCAARPDAPVPRNASRSWSIGTAYPFLLELFARFGRRRPEASSAVLADVEFILGAPDGLPPQHPRLTIGCSWISLRALDSGARVTFEGARCGRSSWPERPSSIAGPTSGVCRPHGSVRPVLREPHTAPPAAPPGGARARAAVASTPKRATSRAG